MPNLTYILTKHQKAKCLLLALLALSTLTPLQAKTKHCAPIALQGDPATLRTSKPALLVFHNVGKNPIYMTHTASPAHASFIEPNRWALLTLTKKKYDLACIESTPGHEQNVPCAQVITVCKWPAEQETTLKTTWVSENLVQLPQALRIDDDTPE